MKLRVDPDELAACVACGLCLPHCPTWRVTGEEPRSPRGRIAAMRAVDAGTVPPDGRFRDVIDSCVGCRGCETACPSGVPFGHLLEGTRATLVAEQGGRFLPAWRRLGYRALGRHDLVLAGSSLVAVLQRTGLVPSARIGLPRRLPVRRPRLVATGTDAWLFTGCVMDAWQRDVHVATLSVLGAAGVGVALPGEGGDCCGALADHAGLVPQTRRLAARVMASMPGDAPVLVNSAGCGAQLLEYGRLLDTPAARAFAGRVVDVHTFLAERLGDLPRPARPLDRRVAVADPCHLRHAQQAHGAVRTLLEPYVREVVELDDDGLCCGAGGAYAVFQPDLAAAIRDRKVAAVGRAAPDLVVSANPGCALHLTNAGLDVRHPMTVVAEALDRR